MSDEHETDEQELREAEALARALDRGSASEDLPEEAFRTAALIRYGGGAVMPDDRHEAILADVLSSAERASERRRARRDAPAPFWRWVLGLAGAAAAVALLLLIVLAPEPGAVSPTALPSPPAELIDGLARPAEDDERFARDMRAYRGAVYATLSERYGAR